MARDSVTVTLDGEVVDRLPAERVVLDYPGLTARAEACMGVTERRRRLGRRRVQHRAARRPRALQPRAALPLRGRRPHLGQQTDGADGLRPDVRIHRPR